MIILDNAVEYTLKSYIVNDQRLVGANKPISREQWDKDKRSFEQALDWVYRFATDKKLPDKSVILSYHETRNELYHGTNPLTVTARKIREYFDQERILLRELFSLTTSDEEWDRHTLDVRKAFTQEVEPIRTRLTFSRYEDEVLVRGAERLNQREAILVVVHAFNMEYPQPPSHEEAISSLRASGHAVGRGAFRVQLVFLRDSGLVKKGTLQITDKCRRQLTRKYFVNRSDGS